MSEGRGSETREKLRDLRKLEDARDLEDARAALADPRNRDLVAWSDLKAQLGIDRETSTF